jgi:hypothetical protein
MSQVSGTLEKNRYTCSPYATAKNLSTTAYEYTVPLQRRLAPAITMADGIANKACDAVEYQFPALKTTQPEEVASYVRERRQSTVDFANKTYDERVKTPAFTVACEVDKRMEPLVSYLETTAVNRLHANAAPADTQYQYQRAYVLSMNLTSQLYGYSHQNVLVQRAIQTGDTITALASSANCRIQDLTHTLIGQLQQVQTSVAGGTTTVYNELGECIGSMGDIVKSPTLTVNEKVLRMTDEITFRMRPLLNRMRGAAARTPPAASDNANGNGHAQ